MQAWNVVLFKTGNETLLEHLKCWKFGVFLLNLNGSNWAEDFQWKYIAFFQAVSL